MSESNIEKTDPPDPNDVLAAIQSFTDSSIIINLFADLGWSYSLEIKETLALAKQNANLSIKFKAIRYLRELLREAAESAGYTANVSQTIPNAQGGQTTFSAKRISGILNPTKQIESTEIKEPQNDRQEPETKSDRGSNRSESQRPEHDEESQEGSPGGNDTLAQFPPERDTGRAISERDAGPGGLEPTDGGEVPGQRTGTTDDTGTDNPCINTRPPTCNPKLFPGISTSAEGES